MEYIANHNNNITLSIQLYKSYKTCICLTRTGGVMIRVFASSVEDRGFEPRSGQTEDYKIGICCFYTKHPGLRRKSKDWLARNHNNVSRVGRHVYPRTVVSVS